MSGLSKKILVFCLVLMMAALPLGSGFAQTFDDPSNAYDDSVAPDDDVEPDDYLEPDDPAGQDEASAPTDGNAAFGLDLSYFAAQESVYVGDTVTLTASRYDGKALRDVTFQYSSDYAYWTDAYTGSEPSYTYTVTQDNRNLVWRAVSEGNYSNDLTVPVSDKPVDRDFDLTLSFYSDYTPVQMGDKVTLQAQASDGRTLDVVAFQYSTDSVFWTDAETAYSSKYTLTINKKNRDYLWRAQANDHVSNAISIPVGDEPIDPELQLSLRFDQQTAMPGETVVCRATLENHSNTPVTDQLFLSLPDGLAYVQGSAQPAFDAQAEMLRWSFTLDAFATQTFLFSVQVTDYAPAGQLYRVDAQAGDAFDSDTLLAGTAELQLSKTVSRKLVTPGDRVTYTVRVKNIGMIEAPAVTVVDTLPRELAAIPSTINHNGFLSDGQITWDLTVPVGKTVTLTYDARISETAVPGDRIRNSVTADGLSDAATVTVVEPEPELSLHMKVSNRTPEPGGTVKYTLSVTNDGSADAYDVKIVDSLPDDLTVVRSSISDDGVYRTNSHAITWYTDVYAGETVKLTFRAQVPEYAEDGETFVNRARIQDGDSAKATITATEDAVPKTGDPSIIPAPPAVRLTAQPETDAATPDEPLPEIQACFAELQAQNADLAGQLVVGQSINQPVVQALDNDFYMVNGFDGKENVAGAIFLDERNHLVPRDHNLLIYGHNMKDGSMFASLGNYRDRAYLDQFPTFTFQSIYDETPIAYRVFAVFDASMDPDNADYVKIRKPNFETPEEAQAYVDLLKQKSLYDTGVDVTADDELITLVTCSYSQENGRLLVFGRRLRADELTPATAAE